jgi:Ca-activated chloride channel family protein
MRTKTKARRHPLDAALIVALLLVGGVLIVGTLRDEFFWKTPDQLGFDEYRAQNYAAAERHFQNRQWKASACYRRGDYLCAAEYFTTSDNADAAYNRGNALARSGKTGSLTAALTSYQSALKRRPEWAPAIHNQRVVADLLLVQSAKKKSDDDGEPGEPNETADGTVVDNRAKHGKPGEVSIEKLDANSVDQIWLRNIKTDPAAFLRLRFAAEQSARNSSAVKQ